MRAPDPAAKLAELVSRPLVKVCGLTREDDVAAAAEAGADLLGFVLAPESPRAAPHVLQVPEGTLAVAVWVGEAGDSPADLDQVHRARRARCGAGRGAPARRRGRRAPPRSALGRGRPGALGAGGGGGGPHRPRRTARSGERARGRSSACARGRSTRARGSSPRPGVKDHAPSARTSRRRGGDLRRLAAAATSPRR